MSEFNVVLTVFTQVWWESLHLDVLSFQCPTEYKEEMEKTLESSSGEQNALPTKRDLIKLHKKVITFLNIALWL